MRLTLRQVLLVSTFATSIATATTAHAQDGARDPAVAESTQPQTSPGAAADSDQAPESRDGGSVADIIVTAQKRDESLLDVPVSLTYVGSDQLDRQVITNVNDLARAVPQLGPAGPNNGLSIRGIGTNGTSRSAEPAVNQVVDGVPAPPVGILFDIDHVEVLLGPQGTLFGKNSSAGVISITTRAPNFKELSVTAHADVGTFEYRNLNAVVNLPLATNAALRVGVAHTGYGDVVYNAVNDDWSDNSETTVRGRLRWEATNALTFDIIGEYSKIRSDGVLTQGTFDPSVSTFRYIFPDATGNALTDQLIATCGVAARVNNYVSCSDTSGVGNKDMYNTKSWGATARIDYALGGSTLTSISGYRWRKQGVFDTNDLWQNDVDGRPFDFLNKSLVPDREARFTQELRIASATNVPLEYVAGVFYSSRDYFLRVDQGGALGALPPPLVLRRVNEVDIFQWDIASFGQLTYNFSEAFRAFAGGRYTHDSLRAKSENFSPACALPRICIYSPGFSLFPVDEKLTNDNFSFRVGGEYHFGKDAMVYASVARGYKAGFVNEQLSPNVVGGVVNPPLAPVVVQPEVPTAYELGIKGSVLNGRLGGTLALFHTRVRDFQTNVTIPATGAGAVPSFGQGNVPYIQTKGVDLTLFGKPLDGLTISAAATYTSANYSPGYSVACQTNYVIEPIPGCVPFFAGSTTGSKVVSGQVTGIPKFRAVASSEYVRKFGSSIEGFVQADVTYRSSLTNLVGDPIFNLGPEARLGGRVGVRTQDGRLSVAVFARNIDQGSSREAITPGRDFAAPGTVLTNFLNFGSLRLIGVSLDGRF